MKTSVKFMAILCAVATASNTRGARGLQAQQDEIRDRILLTLSGTEQCPYSNSIVYFDVRTNVVPDSTSQGCTSSENLQIGFLVNLKLIELGLQDATTSPSSASPSFVAGVCPAPQSVTSGGGFVWVGGGGCRFCNPDNKDGRRSLLLTPGSRTFLFPAPTPSPTPGVKASSFLPPSPSPADLFFDSTVAPAIQQAVVASLQGALKSQFPCTGASPTVTVTIIRKDMNSLLTSGGLKCLDSSLASMLLDGSI